MTFILFLICLLYHDLCAGYHYHDIHSVCAVSHSHSYAKIQVSSFTGTVKLWTLLQPQSVNFCKPIGMDDFVKDLVVDLNLNIYSRTMILNVFYDISNHTF
jgi:hypothetical protein